MAKHSVILGSYNRPRGVHRAIRSVLDNTVKDYQLIVSDDGSNEPTLSVIRELLEGNPRCVLLTAQHLPDESERPDCFSRAVRCINDAIPLARGEIIHYLADDDWYSPERFQVFDKVFEDPQVMVAYGRLVYVNGSGAPYGLERFPATIRDPCGELDQMQLAHRRSAFDRVGLWPLNAVPADGIFMGGLRRFWPFVGTDHVVAFKSMHHLNMGQTGRRSTGLRE